MTSGTDLTILVALAAGLISFLSPCVLPLVPAYLGQLSAIAVAGGGIVRPGRWLAVRHAIAKALTHYEPSLRPVLKPHGFLTRDPRVVERKKYGKAKARRSFQFSKR